MTDQQKKKTVRGEDARGEENASRIHIGREKQLCARATQQLATRTNEEREPVFEALESATGFTPLPSSKLSLHANNGAKAGMVIEREQNTEREGERGGVYSVETATAAVLAEAAITKK